jgi:small multidrug resistance pump
MGSLFLAFSVLCNTVANGFFKAASNVQGMGRQKVLLFGIGLFIGLLNTASYLKALETLNLGTAFAVFAATSTILIALLSFFYFQESLSLQKVLGLSVICAGLLLLWGA